MKKSITLIFIALSLAVLPGMAQKNKLKLKTEVDSVSYALGVNIANSFNESKLSAIKPELLAKGIQDVFDKKQTVLFTDEQANEIIRTYLTAVYAAEANANKELSSKFLEDNSKKPGIVTTSSGLQYKVLVEGTGATPTEADNVTTHYTGMTMDNKVFDSSIERGQPATFPVGGVIRGWTEALQLMKVGSKYQLFIPPDLGYGENPPPGSNIPANAVLIFEVELISIDAPTEPNVEQ